MYSDAAAPERYWVPESEEVLEVLLEVCVSETDVAEAMIHSNHCGRLTFDDSDLDYVKDRPAVPPGTRIFRFWIINNIESWKGDKKYIEEKTTTLWVRKCGEKTRVVRGRWVDPTIM